MAAELNELNNLAEMNYNELEKIKGELKEYIKQVQDIVNENTRLKKQLEYVRGENDKLVKDVNNLKAIIDSWKESYNELNEANIELHKQNERLQNELNNYKNNNKLLQIQFIKYSED